MRIRDWSSDVCSSDLIGISLAIMLTMMGQYWTGAAALGFALAFSSTAIVLPISGTTTPVGRAALSMLLFEDIMIVPIVFLLGAKIGRASCRESVCQYV